MAEHPIHNLMDSAMQNIKEMVDVKSGRRNSKADESKIRQAIELLQDVLGELNEEEPIEGEDEPEANAAAEEQKASNPEKARLLEYIKSI